MLDQEEIPLKYEVAVIGGGPAGPVLLALTFSTYTLQWLAVMGFLPTLMIEEYGLGVGRASVLTALLMAASVPRQP